jgi:hypothetical protein
MRFVVSYPRNRGYHVDLLDAIRIQKPNIGNLRRNWRSWRRACRIYDLISQTFLAMMSSNVYYYDQICHRIQICFE